MKYFSANPRLLLLLLLFLFAATASAQHRLPEGTYTVHPGALEIHSEHYSDMYIFGLGWTSGAAIPDPFIVGQGVSVSRELLDLVTGAATAPPEAAPRPSAFEPAPAQPPTTPAFQAPARPQVEPADPGVARISDVRFGGSGEVRVVFDLPQLNSVARPAAAAPAASPSN